MLKLVQTMSFEVVVFDTAPTGHTLRLLQLPATLEKSLGKLMSMQSGLGGLFNSLMSMMGGAGDVSEESMFSKLQGLKESVEQVNAQFRDASLTTFVCVACPEFLSLYETERLVQELARNDIDVRTCVRSRRMGCTLTLFRSRPPHFLPRCACCAGAQHRHQPGGCCTGCCCACARQA